LALADTVTKLLALGADAALTDKYGNTALELAKDTVTFECLWGAGAKMTDITDKNKNVLFMQRTEFDMRKVDVVAVMVQQSRP